MAALTTVWLRGVLPALLLAGCTLGTPQTSPSPLGPDAAAPESRRPFAEGLDLLLTAAGHALEPASPLSVPIDIPAGTLLVRFEQEVRPDQELVVPVLPGYPQLGWIATQAKAGSTELVPPAPECPSGEVTVPVLYEMSALAPLCFGSADFQFGAFLPGFCGIAGGVPVGEPDWLNGFGMGVTLYGERLRPEEWANPPVSGWVNAKTAPGVSFMNCDPELSGRFHMIGALRRPRRGRMSHRVVGWRGGRARGGGDQRGALPAHHGHHRHSAAAESVDASLSPDSSDSCTEDADVPVPVGGRLRAAGDRDRRRTTSAWGNDRLERQ